MKSGPGRWQHTSQRAPTPWAALRRCTVVMAGLPLRDAVRCRDYWAKVPDHYKGRMHFYNTAYVANKTSASHPLNIMRGIYKSGDMIVVKLDIDNAPLEISIIEDIENDPALVDMNAEMYFEMHYDHVGARPHAAELLLGAHFAGLMYVYTVRCNRILSPLRHCWSFWLWQRSHGQRCPDALCGSEKARTPHPLLAVTAPPARLASEACRLVAHHMCMHFPLVAMLTLAGHIQQDPCADSRGYPIFTPCSYNKCQVARLQARCRRACM